jgi:hypothetical protein
VTEDPPRKFAETLLGERLVSCQRTADRVVLRGKFRATAVRLDRRPDLAFVTYGDIEGRETILLGGHPEFVAREFDSFADGVAARSLADRLSDGLGTLVRLVRTAAAGPKTERG